MLGGFLGVIKAGHFYCSVIVALVEIGAFKEILDLKRNKEKESQIPVSSLLNWYFFLVANFFFIFPQIAKLPGSIRNEFFGVKSLTKIILDRFEVPHLCLFQFVGYWLLGLCFKLEARLLQVPIQKIWLDTRYSNDHRCPCLMHLHKCL
jgi:Cytidylyltransferase family